MLITEVLWFGQKNLINQSKNILDKFYEVLSRLEDIKIQSNDLILPNELEKCFFDDLNISNAFVYLNKIIKKKKTFKQIKIKKS